MAKRLGPSVGSAHASLKRPGKATGGPFGCRANALVDFFNFWERERNFLGASPDPVETPFLTIQFDIH